MSTRPGYLATVDVSGRRRGWRTGNSWCPGLPLSFRVLSKMSGWVDGFIWRRGGSAVLGDSRLQPSAAVNPTPVGIARRAAVNLVDHVGYSAEFNSRAIEHQAG